MKNLARVLVLSLGLGLGSGCAVLPSNEPAVSDAVIATSEAPATVVKVQTAVNEMNVAVTAAYRQVPASVRNGTLTQAEGLKALDELDRISLQLDEAQRRLDIGDAVNAEVKANAATAAFNALREFVYRKASEQ